MWPVAHADYESMESGLQTSKEWHTAGDKLITSSGFGTTLRTWAVEAVRCKIAYYTEEAFKMYQN
jgi:hypothetical protein